MTPVPPSRPRASARAHHAERNVRLDPQGIYGTRSARRQSQLRRRRQLQNALLWLVGAIGLGALARWGLQPRNTARAATQTLQLPFRPAGAPQISSRGDLFFTSQSGGLWRAAIRENAPGENSPIAAPRRVWNEAFAPSAAPLFTSDQIFWPGGDGTLAALDARSGRVQWQATLSSALVARPALVRVEGREIVVAGDDSGVVAAFEARNGTRLWKKILGGAVGAGIGVLSAPNGVGTENGLGDGILVPLLAGDSSRGGLVCLNAKSGTLRWSFPGDARSQGAGVALPVALGNRVFWCNDEGAVVCLDGATGRKIWKSFAAPLQTTTKAGKEDLVMLRSSPTLVEAAGVVVVGGNDGAWRAFDLAGGAPRWTRALGGSVRFAAQNLEFEGKNALLVTGETPALWLLDASDGSVLRRWTTPYRSSYGAAITPKNVLALDADGHLQIAALQ